MITISTKYGRKDFFVNVFQNRYSVGVNVQQYTHDSQHQELLTDRYTMFLENVLTGYKTEMELKYVSSNSRGAYFYFTLGDGTGGSWNISGLGTYKYSIHNMSTVGGLNYSDKLIELDSGLFHIFNAETFTDSYITPDVEVIPTTIAYKPS